MKILSNNKSKSKSLTDQINCGRGANQLNLSCRFSQRDSASAMSFHPLATSLFSRRRSALVPGALVVAFAALGTSSVEAAPANQNLTFAMTARLSYKDAEGKTPAQTIKARAMLSGQKARLETTLGGKPMVILYKSPYVYRLLPTSKVGQRYKANALPQLADLMPGANPLTPDPKAVRAALLKGGAVKTMSAKYQGVPVDVYESKRFRNRPDTLKAFLRRSDSLPMRVQLDSKNFGAVVSWSNYQRPAKLADNLFQVPAGYSVRTVEKP